jgi:hypothetical protein
VKSSQLHTHLCGRGHGHDPFLLPSTPRDCWTNSPFILADQEDDVDEMEAFLFLGARVRAV